MKVHEAWSPEDSQLIFMGNAAVSTVRLAIDAAYDNPSLKDEEITTLIELASRFDNPAAPDEAKKVAVKNHTLESDLVTRGLRNLVYRTSPANTASAVDHFRAWRASRLIGKIARATA